MKQTIIIALIFILTGCEGFKNEVASIGTANTKGDYKVTLFSGGKEVRVWELEDTYISSETDGWFFFIDGKMIRISGDVVIERVR